jgi:hypothetical protein
MPADYAGDRLSGRVGRGAPLLRSNVGLRLPWRKMGSGRAVAHRTGEPQHLHLRTADCDCHCDSRMSIALVTAAVVRCDHGVVGVELDLTAVNRQLGQTSQRLSGFMTRRTFQERPGMVGDPLAKRSRRSEDAGDCRGNERRPSYRCSPRVEQHVHDRRGQLASISRRNSSGDSSSNLIRRPMTSPMMFTCSAWLSDSGPVRT